MSWWCILMGGGTCSKSERSSSELMYSRSLEHYGRLKEDSRTRGLWLVIHATVGKW